MSIFVSISAPFPTNASVQLYLDEGSEIGDDGLFVGTTVNNEIEL